MKQTITSSNAPAAVGPYAPAVKIGSFIFLSGQVPLDPATGKLVTGDITHQTRQIMANLNALLQAAGASLNHVVKTTIFLTDMNDYTAVNATYGEYFPINPPSRSTIQVAALPLDAKIEIEMIAVSPSHL